MTCQKRTNTRQWCIKIPLLQSGDKGRMICLKKLLFIPLNLNDIEVIGLTKLKCNLFNYLTVKEIYFCLEKDC